MCPAAAPQCSNTVDDDDGLREVPPEPAEVLDVVALVGAAVLAEEAEVN